MKAKIEIGTQVKGSKGVGTIVKIITKSTGYVEVDYNGILKKEMAFNLKDMEGNDLKAKPATKPARVEDPIQVWKGIFVKAYDRYNNPSAHMLANEAINKINDNENSFIGSLINMVLENRQMSEKQAFCLAKYGVENGFIN